MPLTEAETLVVFTRKRLADSALGRDAVSQERLARIGERVRLEVIGPFLSPQSSLGAAKALKQAALLLRRLRVEANWILVKRVGWAGLLERSVKSILELRDSLAKGRHKRADWGTMAVEWLDRLIHEHESLRPIMPALDAFGDWNRVPLELVERLLPAELLLSADVEALALNCVASVVDGEVSKIDVRRQTFALRSARQLEGDYTRFLRTWQKVTQELLGAPRDFAELEVSQDPLTIGIVAALGCARESLRWLPRLVQVCRAAFGGSGQVKFGASLDPEEDGLLRLRLNVPTALDCSRLAEVEPAFWREMAKAEPDLIEFISLSYRPVPNEPARVP